MTVHPRRITMALDAPGWGGGPLEGPEVDAACGVAEPTVDLWEEGKLVPTDEQLARLAELTGYPVEFFHADPGPELTGGYLCIRSGKGRGCHFLGKPGEQPLFDAAPEPYQLHLPLMGPPIQPTRRPSR